jgi:hypothetical protein
MQNSTTNQPRYLGLGTLLGAAAAFIAGGVIMARKRRPDAYLRQNGEAAGHCASSIQKHDEKVFREEVASANS